MPEPASITDSHIEVVGGASRLPKSDVGVSSDQVDDESQAESMENTLYIAAQVDNSGTPYPLYSPRMTRRADRKKFTTMGGSIRTCGIPINAKKKIYKSNSGPGRR